MRCTFCINVYIDREILLTIIIASLILPSEAAPKGNDEDYERCSSDRATEAAAAAPAVRLARNKKRRIRNVDGGGSQPSINI